MFINLFNDLKYCATIILLLLFLTMHDSVLAQSPYSGLPFIKSFQTVDYGAGIQNWAITEDQRGIIYVANNYGLLEFDGVQWNTYRVKNATKVRSVAIDGQGRIYVGCQGDFGYFFPDQRGKLTYVSLADSLDARNRNFDEAWSIYIDNDLVYFCTFSRIYIYDGEDFEIVESGSSLDLSFLVNRTLLVNVRNRGLCSIIDNRLFNVPGGEFFKTLSISSILPLGANHFVISTFQDGIFSFQNGVVTPWKVSLQDFFKEAHINCMIRLKDGNFAAGTQNAGLLIIDDDGEINMQLTRGTGLDNRTVLGLFEDDLQNLWVGQVNAISHVESGSPFTFINEQNGLPGTGYAAYFDGRQLYLGTNTGLYVGNENDPSQYNLVKNTGGQVYHIGKYGNQILLGHHTGAYLVGKEAKKLSDEPGSWVFTTLRTHPGKLIEGTYTGLQLYEYVDGGWKWKKKVVGFNESSRVMAEDADGFLWVTHGYKGAYRITLNAEADSVLRVDYYGKEKGFPSNLLINVFKAGDELLFTSESGIYIYQKSIDAFVSLSQAATKKSMRKLLQPNDQLWFILEDAFGNIYFTGNRSIGVLRKNSFGEYALDENIFNKVRRFLNDDLLNMVVLPNNEVLFGAKDGFIHFSPGKKNPVNKNFKALIRKVALSRPDSILFHGNFVRTNSIINGQDDDGPRLPFANNSLYFSFAASGYGGSMERLYQYYLENYETGWSEWGLQTRKEYTNLKEGDYVFHVRAKDNNGNVSDEARFKFSIAAPWYRSAAAYVLYSFGVIVILFAGFNLMDKKYQREQKMLEEKQQQEIEQKESEIEQISLQSKEEITRLQNEKLESDLQHMNRELATATMHLLTKNEFITGVKNHLNQIIRKNGFDDSKNELVRITRDIENNISADSDWENFQFHFDRVHGDFTNRFKATFPSLSPQEIKLSAYLRMNLSTKEIAQLLNISVRGVEISRYRLRKKLQLDRSQNLQEFILTF